MVKVKGAYFNFMYRSIYLSINKSQVLSLMIHWTSPMTHMNLHKNPALVPSVSSNLFFVVLFSCKYARKNMILSCHIVSLIKHV